VYSIFLKFATATANLFQRTLPEIRNFTLEKSYENSIGNLN